VSRLQQLSLLFRSHDQVHPNRYEHHDGHQRRLRSSVPSCQQPSQDLHRHDNDQDVWQVRREEGQGVVICE
jgi:hypothetical protein